MQATFGLTREQRNEMYVADYESLNGSVFHFHSQIEIVLVKSGEVEVCIGENIRTLHKGELAIATSFTPHVFRSGSDSSSSILFVPTYLCEEFVKITESRRFASPFVTDSRAVMRISEFFDGIKDVESNKIERAGYANAILGIILRHIQLESNLETVDTPFIAKLLLHINREYRSDLSINRIASDFGYSPSYVARCFRSCFGVTVNQYVTTLRLKSVILLLKSGRTNVTDCALESGFNSTRTFYRAFKTEFGCSPKEYIKNFI